MYKIIYYDHRADLQEITCSAYEDAERVAQFLADMYGQVELKDEFDTITFKRKG